ncbi:MAG TPA: Pvc16 family protein [Blastocatellia bacterium]|nr:Pvc16 family protein [Blastocatellia bacterium]
MIEHLSKTLQALLTLNQAPPDQGLKEFFAGLKKQFPLLADSIQALAKDFPALATAVIKFDRPIDNYQGEDTGTVNLFLYDIRENMELRSNEPIIQRNNGEAILRRAPRRVACSYLVTAWYGSAEKDKELKEQALLSQALQVLSSFPTIPGEMLWESLKEQQPPLPMVTLAADGVKNPAEFWTALGGKLRPAFTVTVTVSLPALTPEKPVALVKKRELRVGEKAPGGQDLVRRGQEKDADVVESPFRIFGRITDPEGAPVRGAIVTATDDETEISATADDAGRYSLEGLSTGTYTLRAASAWKQSDLNPEGTSITIPGAAERSCDLKLTRGSATQKKGD